MSLNKRSVREFGDNLLKLPQPTLYPQITYIPFTTKITHRLQKKTFEYLIYCLIELN